MQTGMMKIFTTLLHRDRTQGKQVWHTCTQGITHLAKRKWWTTQLLECYMNSYDICIWYGYNSNAPLFIEHKLCNRSSSAQKAVWFLRINLTRCVGKQSVQKDSQKGRKLGLQKVSWGNDNSRFVLTQTQCYCTPKHVRNWLERLALPKHH